MEKYNGKSPRIIYIQISFKNTYLPSPYMMINVTIIINSYRNVVQSSIHKRHVMILVFISYSSYLMKNAATECHYVVSTMSISYFEA